MYITLIFLLLPTIVYTADTKQYTSGAIQQYHDHTKHQLLAHKHTAQDCTTQEYCAIGCCLATTILPNGLTCALTATWSLLCCASNEKE